MSAHRRLVLLAVGIGAAFVAAAVALPHDPRDLLALAGTGGVLTALVLLGGWIALTPALFPGTVLAAATGAALGPVFGFGVALAGATLGGLVAFAAARRLGAPAVNRLEGERLARLQRRLERRGLMTIACVRFAPGVPATALHYVAGASRVRPAAFAGGIALGGAPRVAAYTALGGSLTDPTSPVLLVAVAVLAAMGVVPVAIAWRRRRAPSAAAS